MNERFRTFVYGLAASLMLGYLLYVGRGVLVPVITAVVVAYVITTLARLFGRVPGFNAFAPVWLRYAIAGLAVASAIALIVYLIAANIGQVVAQAPRYEARLADIVKELAAAYGFEAQPAWQVIRSSIFDVFDLQGIVRAAAASVSNLAIGAFVVIVYTGFLLAEERFFQRKIDKMSSDPDDVALLRKIIADINDRIGEYLTTKTVVNLILGLMSYIVMAYFGLELAAFWAVLIALLNYIPYVGSVLGVLFPVAVGLVQIGSLATIGLMFAGLTAAQVVVGSIIEPRILGRALNLSPFVILLAVTTWGSLWGVAGALLAVPITASLVIVLSEFEGTRAIAVFLSRNGKLGRVRRIQRRSNGEKGKAPG